MRRRRARWWSRRDVEQDIATVREVVRRIVQIADPDEVILFGSAAHGRLRPDSDFDILIIKSDVRDPQELIRYLHAHLFDIKTPIDLIVATPEEVAASQFKMLAQIYARGRRMYMRELRQDYPPPQRYQARW